MASAQYGLPNFAALDKKTSMLLMKILLDTKEHTDFSALITAAQECEDSIKAERENAE